MSAHHPRNWQDIAAEQAERLRSAQVRIDDLQAEVHFWRALMTPVRAGLQLMRRRHAELAEEIDPLVARFDDAPTPDRKEPSDAAFEILVTIALPSREDAQLRIAAHLNNFVEMARRTGAAIGLRPSPDDIERELVDVKVAIDALPPEHRAQFTAQLGRIESLNKFRRLADGLLPRP
jgi:hypothetical protein